MQEFFEDKFKFSPPIGFLKDIADFISWNLWQMDGLEGIVPYSDRQDKAEQISLLNGENTLQKVSDATESARQNNLKIYCKIKDWKTGEEKGSRQMKKFEESFRYKLIYIFEIRDNAHRGLLKIGDATIKINCTPEKLTQKILNQAAKDRIKEYTNTAGIEFYLLHAELAVYKTTDKNGKEILKAFRDHDVHLVLLNSNIERQSPHGSTGKEWFRVNLETAKEAITAVKENRKNLSGMLFETENFIPITLRPEQEEAVSLTVKELKKGDKFLWNAKMRFGKTLAALEVVRRMEFAKTIIITHRPVVDSNWYEDFQKIFHNNENFIYGSKNHGYKVEELLKRGKNFVYFASMQDLRGSETVGGKFSKNAKIFSTDWDFVIVDEAHEGTKTALGKSCQKRYKISCA